jgi:hypothetical protein
MPPSGDIREQAALSTAFTIGFAEWKNRRCPGQLKDSHEFGQLKSAMTKRAAWFRGGSSEPDISIGQER